MREKPNFILIFLGSYAAAIHYQFIHVLRDPLIYPDSISYLTPALDRLFNGTWSLGTERTIGYPLFLYFYFLLFKGFGALILTQHILVLAKAMIAGALYYRFFKPSSTGAALVFFLTAISPEATVLSHAVMSDTLYAFLVIGTTFYFLKLCSRAPRFTAGSWILLGVGLAGSILVRPTGYALALVIGLWGFFKKPTRRPHLYAIGAMAAVLFSYGLLNETLYHEFVITSKGASQIFGVAARYLDVSQIQDRRVRETLTPIYASMGVHKTDPDWIRISSQGPAKALLQIYGPVETNRILNQLSRQALSTHKEDYMVLQIKLLWEFILHKFSPAGIYRQMEFIFFFYRGLDLVSPLAAQFPALRTWFSQPPESGRVFIQALQTLMRLPPQEAQARLEALYAATPYRYDRAVFLWKPLAPLFSLYGGLAVLGLLAGLYQLKNPQTCFAAACLLSLIIFHIILVNMAGANESRYAIPLEPLLWILLVAGIPFDRRTKAAFE